MPAGESLGRGAAPLRRRLPTRRRESFSTRGAESARVASFCTSSPCLPTTRESRRRHSFSASSFSAFPPPPRLVPCPRLPRFLRPRRPCFLLLVLPPSRPSHHTNCLDSRRLPLPCASCPLSASFLRRPPLPRPPDHHRTMPRHPSSFY